MASVEEDGTAAAAEQIGSMSLGESVKSKSEPENNEDADKNGPPAKRRRGKRDRDPNARKAAKKFCSACGKKSDTAKKCTACKCVWYCDKDCQNKHWKEHKKECKPIKKVLEIRGGNLDLGEEMDLGPLSSLPPREECPICMHALPIHPMLSSYDACCGKITCRACGFLHQRKSRELAAERGHSPGPSTCAFCRTVVPTSPEEILARLRKRVKLNDPVALCNLAMEYGYGDLGIPVDPNKCIDLLRQSAGLGYPDAQWQLGNFYHNGEMGLERNKEEALRFYKEAGKGGFLSSLYNLGCSQAESGDHIAGMCHWRLSASGGYRASMGNLIICFQRGLLHHDDLAKTLQAMYRSRAEMRSEDRVKFIEHLKNIGEYDEDYDL